MEYYLMVRMKTAFSLKVMLMLTGEAIQTEGNHYQSMHFLLVEEYLAWQVKSNL